MLRERVFDFVAAKSDATCKLPICFSWEAANHDDRDKSLNTMNKLNWMIRNLPQHSGLVECGRKKTPFIRMRENSGTNIIWLGWRVGSLAGRFFLPENTGPTRQPNTIIFVPVRETHYHQTDTVHRKHRKCPRRRPEAYGGSSWSSLKTSSLLSSQALLAALITGSGYSGL